MIATGIIDERPVADGPVVPARRGLPPLFLLGASGAVAVVLLAPLLFLLLEASGSGVGTIAHLIWRSLTATLLWTPSGSRWWSPPSAPSSAP
jgi:hypothetical protein